MNVVMEKKGAGNVCFNRMLFTVSLSLSHCLHKTILLCLGSFFMLLQHFLFAGV